MKVHSQTTFFSVRTVKKLVLFSFALTFFLSWLRPGAILYWEASELVKNRSVLTEASLRWHPTIRNISEELETSSVLPVYRVREVNEKLQAQLWNRARLMLGLSLPSSGTEYFGSPDQEFVAGQFYTKCTLKSKSLLDGSAIYVRIPKNGNNNIRCNTLAWPGLADDVRCLNSTEGYRLIAKGTRIWTFLRDPISRFISGYTEVEYRNKDNRQAQRKFASSIGTPERFREFVHSLLEGKKVHEIYHVFAQSSIGSQFPLVTAGKIDNMERDWIALQEWLDLPNPRGFVLDCSTHPTSSDPLGTTAAARVALAHDHSLMNAICALLLPDYLNFEYTLPEECKLPEELTGTWTL